MVRFLLLTLALVPVLAQPRKLLVVSIDGLDTRYLHEPDRYGVRIPALRRLMTEGAAASGVVGVVPTVTWPSHTSIISGVTPEEHNIPTNDQPGKPGQRWWFTSFLKARTLWHATAEKKLKSAGVYWPVTVGATIDFNFPEFWKERAGHDVPFDDIAEKATPGLEDKVSHIYPTFARSRWSDTAAMQATRYILEFEKPDLALVHIADLDAEQHDFGVFSKPARATLELADQLLGWVLEKRPPRMVVAIVSDHGFDNAVTAVRPKAVLREAGLAPAGAEVREGLIGALDDATAAFFRSRIGSHGIAREVPIAEVQAMAPKLARWRAAFDMKTGHFANNDDQGPPVAPGNGKGSHGLWPTRENYRASFVLWGEGVRPVRLGEISMLDIAPTFAAILGVDLPAARRASLWPRVATLK
ncbi:MAG: alkaline phosphatase family protein [Bryobacteraceae bacterium]